MKKRTVIVAGIVLVLVGVAAIPYAVHRSVRSRIGPAHTYELSEQPKHLTEDLALAKARDTLRQEGLDIAAWQPVRFGRSAAPDGRRDEFASRNALNPNRVVFHFTNGTAVDRFVSVELDGRRVVCQTSISK